MNFRTGIGFDVHQLQTGHDFYLGGVQIDYSKGTIGHSDGDVLLHAICDALLGAANLGDIGQHFPDTDPDYKNIDSKELLKKAGQFLQERSYSIVNIDSIVCLQQPKLASYLPKMKETIAQTLTISQETVSVKATTTEKLGFIGKGKGVASYAMVLVNKTD